MSNQYISIIMSQGSKNTNNALEAHRNLALAQGRGNDALMLEAIRQQNKSSGSGGGACFTKDSKVLTPSGPKDISKLRVGEKVLSIINGKTCIESIKKVIEYAPHVVYDYKLSNNDVISATEHHTILTENGWKQLKNIPTGSEIIIFDDHTKSNKTVTIEQKGNKRREPVYNLHTSGAHNFIVNGVIAHNFTFARKLRSTFHSLCEKLEVFPVSKYEVSF